MKKIFFCLLFIIISLVALSQDKEITLEGIYKDYNFYPKSYQGLKSMNNGEFYTQMKRTEDGQEIIKYNFNDKSLLIKSLTHTSASTEKVSSMERLEFLGDRILGLVISEAIFSKFNSFNEGDLSRYHNYLVQRSTCVIIAKKINLNNFIIFGKSEFSKDGLRDSILSNILESLIGAVFEEFQQG